MQDNLNVSNDPHADKKRIGRTLWLIIAAWTLLVVGVSVWDASESYKAELKTATSAARDSFNKDVIYRRWSAMQGGVYVPVSKQVPPNPYLKHIPERDITTPSGRRLTLVNPAYMTRQVHDLGNVQYGVMSHITSLKPIRPRNAPDEWEKKALREFQKGSKEVASLEKLDNTIYLRFMRPLITEQSCLKCHAGQGYKKGDIRGGISVSVPWMPYRESLIRRQVRHTAVHSLIWLLGIIGLVLVCRGLQRFLYERKLSTEELRRTKAILQVAMDQSQVGIAIADAPSGALRYVNDAGLLIRGSDREHLVNGVGIDQYVSSWQLLDLDGRPLNTDEVPLARATMFGETCSREFIIRRDLGDDRTVLANAAPITDDDGKVVAGIVVFLDITERKQAEGALQALFTRQDAILGAVPDIIMEVDNDKVYTWANSAGLEFFGEDVIGKEAAYYFLGEQDVLGLVQPLFNGSENVIYLESWQRRKDGEKRLLAWWCRVLKDAEGNVTGALSTARDITERKQAEEALRESEAKYRAMVETFPLAIHMSVGIEQIAEYINPRFIGLFGYTLEDIRTSKQWWLLAYPDETYRKQISEKWTTNIKRAIETQSPIEPVEAVVTCKDGSKKIISWSYITLGDKNYACGLDLTERKQAEAALVESEARVRSLISSMAEGVAFHSIVRGENGEPVNYRITDLNPQYETITGLRKADVLGKLATEAYGMPEPPHLAEYTSACGTMKSTMMETYFPQLDKHFIVSVAPLNADSFATIFFEVTEQKRVEEAIRASEANYRTIFDTAGDAMIVHDSDTGAIVDVNRKCCEMFGYTRKEMRGLVIADISAEEPAYTQENALRWMRRAMKGKAQLFEWKGKDRSGQVFWLEVGLKRATISGEQRLIAAVRDISQRKHFEEAVAARAFWEGIAQTMRSGLAVMAPNGTLSYANEAFYDLVGYSSDELAGAPPPYPWMDAHPNDDPLLSEEETRGQQCHVRHKSGRHIPVIVSVSDLKGEQGNTVSRFAVYQDISNMVAMEEQLARSERLALLGQLAGSIGHELRNPLGVVQSSVYYLRSKLKDRDEKIDRHLDRLENSVAFSDKVITDLLSFARVPNLAKHPMAMGVFMNRLLEEFAANEKVTAAVNVEIDKTIMADETQMTQLFHNLISNAHDAMPDGGQLSVSVRPSADNMMEIGVSDTGQGMTEEVLAKAFEPLYTTKARGAGFGLSICRKIVESHGGSISITSEPGKGTRVLVSLPM